MRLINAETRKLEEFFGINIPSYAILSHTWGEEEVSFHDIQNPEICMKKLGYEKIARSCTQTIADGLNYIWVDTCCIDKTSSAELTEAINSMFLWYKNAEVCYAFLADLAEDGDLDSGFSKCRWFTRGWTLQELIAPSNVRFYDAGWHIRGTKADLKPVLSDITGIDTEVLSGADLGTVSVAQRMAWAAFRQTTRIEDTAYCLLGIFDVNMPMLYGEGQKAFIRLQEEIVKDCDDHSLFAWKAAPGTPEFRGIFANSPSEFANSRDITSYRVSKEPCTMTSRGLRVHPDLYLTSGRGEEAEFALNCRQGNRFEESVAIYLGRQSGNQYMRVRPQELDIVESRSSWDTSGNFEEMFGKEGGYMGGHTKNRESIFIVKNIPSTHPLESSRKNAFWVRELSTEASGFSLRDACPSQQWDAKNRLLVTSGKRGFLGALLFRSSTQENFLVVLGIRHHAWLMPWCAVVCLYAQEDLDEEALKKIVAVSGVDTDKENFSGPISGAFVTVTVKHEMYQGLAMCPVDIKIKIGT